MKKLFLVGVLLLVFLASCSVRKNAPKESSSLSYYSLVEVTIKIVAPANMPEDMKILLAKATEDGAFKIECPKSDSLRIGQIVTATTLALHASNDINEFGAFSGWAMFNGIPLKEIQGPDGHFYQGVITNIEPFNGKN